MLKIQQKSYVKLLHNSTIMVYFFGYDTSLPIFQTLPKIPNILKNIGKNFQRQCNYYVA